MRFYLDHDVSALCRQVLTDANHEAWTANQAGLALAEDDYQKMYADDKDAVLVSHDRRFARARIDNTTTRSIWLNCDMPDGPSVLSRHLTTILPILEHREFVMIELQPDQFTAHMNWR